MMSTSTYASRLRHGLKSAVLGGAAFDTLIDDAELERLERASKKPFSEQEWFWKNPDDMAQSIFVVLDEPGTSKLATIFSLYMQLLIFVSSVIFVVETLESVKTDQEALDIMHVVEWICVGQFTVEYIIRMSVCTHRPGEIIVEEDGSHRVNADGTQARDRGFCSYATAFMNLVDFCAIAPAYVELVFQGEGGGFAVLRILRLARIFRVVKVGSFAENLALVLEALRRSKSGLLLLVYLVLIFMVIMSSILYMVEDGDPDTSFVTIPDTFWCTIVTMTSVGYGDMYPITDAGRAVGSFIMLSGILTLAVPITLIGNNFQDVWVAAKKKKEKGKMIAMLAQGADGDGAPDNIDGSRKVSDMEISTRLQTAILVLEQSFDVTQHAAFEEALSILSTAEQTYASARADEG